MSPDNQEVNLNMYIASFSYEFDNCTKR